MTVVGLRKSTLAEAARSLGEQKGVGAVDRGSVPLRLPGQRLVLCSALIRLNQEERSQFLGTCHMPAPAKHCHIWLSYSKITL